MSPFLKIGLLLCFISISLQPASAQVPAHPFPQRVAYTKGVILPAANRDSMENNVRHFYDAWKKKYLRLDPCTNSLYVHYDDENLDIICVSEGQGYGMVIVAYMAGYDTTAKKTYDSLYRYYQTHIVDNPSDTDRRYRYLMSGFQTSQCNSLGDAATDGDMDIAYSLLLADAQWGSGGDINYMENAANITTAISAKEVNDKAFTLLKGNFIEKPDINDPKDKGSSDYFDMRSSDFMPAHLSSFSKRFHSPVWDKTIESCYKLFITMQRKYSEGAGLLPDFIVHVRNPKPAGTPYEEYQPALYYHNACRVPWRIATDYILNGDSNAKAIVQKINNWIIGTTKKDPGNIAEGYHLNGKPLHGAENFPVMSFVCPLAVSAMVDKDNQQWLNNLYQYILQQKADPAPNEKEVERYDYYNNTIKMYTLIILSGNYWQP
jgi:endo-1,4-beta-D-glucanase Y